MDTIFRNTCPIVDPGHSSSIYVTYLNRNLLGCHVSLVKRQDFLESLEIRLHVFPPRLTKSTFEQVKIIIFSLSLTRLAPGH